LREDVEIREPSSYQPRPVAPLALPCRLRDASTAASRDAPGEVFVAMHGSTVGSPFLAQYLAQQFFADYGQPPRWRERDGAYRRAGHQPIVPRLSLDI
jgi:hypothetical protein